jgi:chemotaxis protein methyltransferase CheR
MEKMAFQKIKRLIYERAGLDCSGYRDEYLKRRFEIRLRATGVERYGKYLLYLKKNPDEFQNLLNDLTINYTMFFRDSDVYAYLEKRLLPKILSSSNPARIWSAGCATGEEPYSLAILVHKILGQSIANHVVTIFASDIDKDALSKAENGVYQEKQLGYLDAASFKKFFTKNGENCRVNDFVKRIVRFEQVDLNTSGLHENIDLILCRNVMIYFSKESQQLIHMNFYNALKDGGYLITGKSEVLSGEPFKRFLSVDTQTRVFQKPLKSNENLKIDTLNFTS